MPDLRRIEKPKQLLVEGRDAEEFFEALLRDMNSLEEIQIQNFGGINELPSFLRSIQIAPGPDGTLVSDIVSMGIIRDAEGPPEDAFKSVCSALSNTGLDTPNQPEIFDGNSPRVGVLILPDAVTKGMLEDLCLRSVEGHPAMQCIDEYFDCLESQTDSMPRNISKAKVQAFLASMPEQVLHLGLAAHKGYWPWDNSAFDHIKRFLSSL